MPFRIGFAAIVFGLVASLATAQEPADPMVAMERMPAMDHWMWMVHGWAYLNYNDQGGPSGGDDFESQNHVMGMATHSFLGGKLTFYGTFSLEPATIPEPGSHELFQVGETNDGVLLVDYQHPHDFFIQLAGAWQKTFGPGFGLRFYAAAVGEPALGPPAFVHRLSASANPTAPLSHHNQDSTHISYDVLTLGLTASIFTLEASGFHGAEPDENRWNIESGAIDSYGVRLTAVPLPGLTVQLSGGHLTNPRRPSPGTRTVSPACWRTRRLCRAGSSRSRSSRDRTRKRKKERGSGARSSKAPGSSATGTRSTAASRPWIAISSS